MQIIKLGNMVKNTNNYFYFPTNDGNRSWDNRFRAFAEYIGVSVTCNNKSKVNTFLIYFEKFGSYLIDNPDFDMAKLLTLPKTLLRTFDIAKVAKRLGFKNCVVVGSNLYVDCPFDIGILNKFDLEAVKPFENIYTHTCKKHGIKKSKELKTVLKHQRENLHPLLTRKVKNLYLDDKLTHVKTSYASARQTKCGYDKLSALVNGNFFDNRHGVGLVMYFTNSNRYNLAYYYAL